MNSLNIKKDDNVIVIAGKDKGKTGKVLATFPKTGKVIVEGVNMATTHVKASGQNQQGGIITKELAMPACKVMRVCPKCGKPTRAAHVILADGSKARKCKKCGETI
ncbi:MAG: 50S ribosomal protein L24 [Ruminococcaceae bacterium]|nr:50S ribosomal protein L24 [Oscillospiraceae bacterium]